MKRMLLIFTICLIPVYLAKADDTEKAKEKVQEEETPQDTPEKEEAKEDPKKDEEDTSEKAPQINQKFPPPPKQVAPTGLHMVVGKKAEVIINNLAKKGFQGKLTKENFKDGLSFTGLTSLNVAKEKIETKDKTYTIRKPQRLHVGSLNGEMAAVTSDLLSGQGDLEHTFKVDAKWVKNENGDYVCVSLKKIKCIKGTRIHTVLPHERFDRLHQRVGAGEFVLGISMSGAF